MGPAVNTLRPAFRTWFRTWIGAALAVVPLTATAQDPVSEELAREEEGRWMTSLAVTSGVLIQQQHGSVESCLFTNPADATGCPAPGSVPLRQGASGSSRAIAAFVGATLEAMTPALPVPTRPRVFLSGEIIPTFSSDRDLAVQGDPGCVKGPEPGDTCASQQQGPRLRPFGEDAALGQGSAVEMTYETLTFGGNLGVAFPVRVRERRVQIKPSAAWISYAIKTSGTVVDAECEPPTRCTDTGGQTGLLRETQLMGSDTQRFHAIGPGLEVEMETGRVGPLGTSVFVAGRAYRTLGDRKIEVETVQTYGDDGLPLANQAVAARWESEAKPWMYRAGVGLRIQWLGWAK